MRGLNELQHHVAISHNERSLACFLCGNTYFDHNLLQQHVIRHTQNPLNRQDKSTSTAPETTVEEDSKPKNRVSVIQWQHKQPEQPKQTSHDERSKSLICEKCRESFSDEQSRKRHVNERHVIDVRNYCRDCKMKFRDNEGLRTHQNQAHTVEQDRYHYQQRRKVNNDGQGSFYSDQYHH